MFPKSLLTAFAVAFASASFAAPALASPVASSVTSTTSADVVTNVATASIAAATASSASGYSSSSDDEQDSLTLDPSVIASGFAQDGQATPTPGQVASRTSKNNFINFCSGKSVPITNGQQITSGSCNPAPMGILPSTANMPSSKFTFPTNFGTVKANTPFTVTMAINNLAAGVFTNADSTYFAAPQQLDADGNIKGHSHFVIEQLYSMNQTTPTTPTKFAFFKGVDDAAVNDVLSADVSSGLPAGIYRLASINTAANHQPVLVPIAQHGTVDDMVYFTVE